MTESSDVRDIAALLEDEYAHEILLSTNEEAMSVAALAEDCDVSPSTIYRRIEQLQAYDLLNEQVEIDPEGHHYKKYTARLDSITVDLTEDGFEIEVSHRKTDSADRFTDLFEGFR